jgi:alpha-glucosidase
LAEKLAVKSLARCIGAKIGRIVIESFQTRLLLPRKIMIMAALCLALGVPSEAAINFVGNVTTTAVGQDMVDFAMDSGAVARVQMMAPDLVRVRVNPSGTFSTLVSGAIAPSGLSAPGTVITDTPSASFLQTAQMLVAIQKQPLQIFMVRSDGSLIFADLANSVGWDSVSGLIFAQKFAPATEHYFGLGMLGGPLDRRGRQFVLANQSVAAYGEFSDPLYASYPFYYGLNNGLAYGVFLDNPAAPFFNMDSNQFNGVVTFGAAQGELDYYVMAGPDPAQVANTYGELTGFPPVPPKWTLGYHQSGFGYRSEAQILTTAQTFRSSAIPCDALYFDLFYENNLNIFSYDPVAFPTPQSMNQTLDTSGFKRVAIFDSALNVADPLYSPLSSSGFFLGDGTGKSLVATTFIGPASFLDFSQTQVRNWYEPWLGSFLRSGINAVWNDMDEPWANYIPNAVYGFDGSPHTDLQARNVYALQQASASYAAQQQTNPNIRPWVLTAPGYSGIQRYAAGFSGDTLSTFDSLRVSLQISLHMGLSGQAQFGHDVGGFLGSPTPELYIRWLEFCSFVPFFRTHSFDLIAPREPWTYGEPYTSMARSIINQHYRLLPYLYTLAESTSRTGAPILAPLVYYFPADAQTYTQDQEFMLGPSLLVAPVIQQGASTRSVYLPAGSNWIDYYSDSNFSGGQTVTASAPLERIPLFVRAGAILTEGPQIQFVDDQSAAPAVILDVYPGPDSSFTLYEDNGSTLDYQSGAFLRTQIAKAATSTGTLLQITKQTGSWVAPPRPIWATMHSVATAPSTISLNGKALPLAPAESNLASMSQGWFYDGTKGQLLVRVQDDSALAISIQN